MKEPRLVGKLLPQTSSAVGSVAGRCRFSTPDDDDDPDDVSTAAVMHPGLTRSDPESFVRQAPGLRQTLTKLPTDVDLGDADDSLVFTLCQLPVSASNEHRFPSLSLLTKVLHRKRPRLMHAGSRPARLASTSDRPAW